MANYPSLGVRTNNQLTLTLEKLNDQTNKFEVKLIGCNKVSCTLTSKRLCCTLCIYS